LSKYRIFETEQFSADLEDLPRSSKLRIQKKLRDYVYPQLINCPQYGANVKKLRNYSPDTWRYRIGDYRLFFEIDEEESIVSMIAIDLRKDAY
jgi:mRNA interferase RelE/StbE